jgi:hypothetical protein
MIIILEVIEKILLFYYLMKLFFYLYKKNETRLK